MAVFFFFAVSCYVFFFLLSERTRCCAFESDDPTCAVGVIFWLFSSPPPRVGMPLASMMTSTPLLPRFAPPRLAVHCVGLAYRIPLRQIKNALNEDLPVGRSRDGMELHYDAGRKVTRRPRGRVDNASLVLFLSFLPPPTFQFPLPPPLLLPSAQDKGMMYFMLIMTLIVFFSCGVRDGGLAHVCCCG